MNHYTKPSTGHESAQKGQYFYGEQNCIWLVVWNMAFIFPFSWECHHPN
jgi:hypothetical protein